MPNHSDIRKTKQNAQYAGRARLPRLAVAQKAGKRLTGARWAAPVPGWHKTARQELYRVKAQVKAAKVPGQLSGGNNYSSAHASALVRACARPIHSQA